MVEAAATAYLGYSARPVRRVGRRRAADQRGAGRAHADPGAAGARVVPRRRSPAATSSTTLRPGRSCCRPSTRRCWPTRTAPSTSPGSSRSPRRCGRASTGSPRRSRDGGGVGWHEHDRACSVGIERLFRPGYRHQLVADLATGARRRRGQAAGRRAGSPTSAAGTASRQSSSRRPSRRPPSSASTPTRRRSTRPASAAAEAGCRRPRPVRGRPTRRRCPAPATTWCASSTACTTWATRSAPPAVPGTRWPPTGRCCSSSPGGRRAGRQPQSGQQALLRGLGVPVHPERAGPGRGARARRPGRRGPAGRGVPRAGFGRFRRATDTPFNLVLEARP